MSIFDNLSEAWEDFRELAPIEITVNGRKVSAVQASEISQMLPAEDGVRIRNMTCKIVVKTSDWQAAGGEIECLVVFNGRNWRAFNPTSFPGVSPYVAVDLVSES